jgi:GDP-L-fucose synthase
MEYLTGRSLLVTGGAGFLGRQVCRLLKTYCPAQIFVPRSAAFDLRRREAIQQVFAEAQPDVVIHLAAVVGGIGANQRQPGRFFYDNAIMGLELMEEARQRGVLKFVGVGTICSYPHRTPIPFCEEDLWNGYPEETNAPYGLAKKMLLVQAQAYRQQYGFNAITLLPTNLYGPHDNFDPETSHVIPALIRKAMEARDAGRPYIEAWGTSQASREFLFVRDAAEAIVRATARYDGPDPVNIGSGEEIAIQRLAEMICDLCGYRGGIRWDASKPDGQPRRCVDTTRARRELSFVASTSLRDGLAETIAWYEKTQARRVNEGRSPTLADASGLY